MAEFQVPQDLEGEEELEILFDGDDNVLYPEALQAEGEMPFGENMADYLEEGILGQISSQLISSYEDDLSSRQD